MQKIKKQIPVILYALLLLVITVLCIVIANSPKRDAEAETKNPPTIDKNNTDNTSSVTDDIPTASNPTPEPEITKPDYSDSIPRSANSDELYLFTQKIYGNGKTELLDVFQTSVGIYSIIQTESTKGDVCGKSPCLGIVKTDSYGNILKSLSLDFTYSRIYVTACPTALGLVLVSSPQDKAFFYLSIVSYDLDETPVYRIAASDGGKIIATGNSFLFFSEYPDELVVYSYTGSGLTFQSIGNGKIIELFDFGTYYTLFTSGKNECSYSIIKLAKSNLSVISEITVNGSTALAVFPVSSEYGQSFIILENRLGTIWTKKYKNSSFSEVLDSKRIGNFNLLGAYFDGEKILLVCSGNLSGIISVTPNLATEFVEIGTDYIATDILDGIFIGGTLYYLTSDEENTIALVYSKDNTVTIKFFDVKTSFAQLILNLDGTFELFYQNGDFVSIIGIEK